MRKKSALIFLSIVAVFLFPLQAFATTYNFVYDYSTSLRSKDYKFSYGGNGVTVTFSSVQCRSGKTMTVEVKHNVSWGSDTTLTRKTIPECGGTVSTTFSPDTPVYFIISKPNDGYWVKGTGSIYN